MGMRAVTHSGETCLEIFPPGAITGILDTGFGTRGFGGRHASTQAHGN
jgi:hypothetical protein